MTLAFSRVSAQARTSRPSTAVAGSTRRMAETTAATGGDALVVSSPWPQKWAVVRSCEQVQLGWKRRQRGWGIPASGNGVALP